MTKQPQWVKCSERMPDHDGFFWVINMSNGGKPGRQREAKFKCGEFYSRDTATESWRFETKPSHWLDCPDPEPVNKFEAWWGEQRKPEPYPSECQYRYVDGKSCPKDMAREIWNSALRCHGVKVE